MKRLHAQWLSYRNAVVPAAADGVQVEECRRAFYAGAAALFDLVNTMLDPTPEPSAADLAKMAELMEELREFGRSIRAQGGKRAQPN